TRRSNGLRKVVAFFVKGAKKVAHFTPPFSAALNFKESIIDLSMSDIVAIVSLLAAALSALYARWSAAEAKKANDIGRLNALLAFRAHYLELMAQKGRVAEQLKGMKGAEKAYEEYAELDSKLRQVNKEIESYHSKVVASKI